MPTQTILVIDDEESIRDAFVLALEDSSYLVYTAESGQQGIEIAQRIKPQLIFLDLKMPGMDGVETLRQLRKILDDVRVHILTAFHQEYLRPLQELADQGFDFELTRKPIDSVQIVKIVTAMMRPPSNRHVT